MQKRSKEVSRRSSKARSATSRSTIKNVSPSTARATPKNVVSSAHEIHPRVAKAAKWAIRHYKKALKELEKY